MAKSKNFSRSDYIQALCGQDLWAIQADWAETLAGWGNLEDFNPQALVTKAGERFGTGMTRTSVRDSVGIMQIRGPLFTHENFLTWLFGFDTYESLGRDFENLMNNDQVKGVILNFHSPGGLTAGVDDLASMIYEGRSEKRIISRAGGNMASAAYWLGSSAGELHISSTGMVGSIGTLVQFRQDDSKVTTIVSDQSPKKAPDLSTPEGQAEIKQTLNALSSVFIDRVARNRGVSQETVLSDFGQGGVLVGEEALGRGMADKVTTFESTFHTMLTENQQENHLMSKPAQSQTPENTTAPGAQAPEASTQSQTPGSTQAPAPAQAQAQPSVENAVKAERDRVSGIMSTFAGTGFEGEAQSFVADGKSVSDAQAYVISKLKANGANRSNQAPSQASMAAEGAQANQASQTRTEPTAAEKSKAIRSAMTFGANQYRSKVFGAAANQTKKSK